VRERERTISQLECFFSASRDTTRGRTLAFYRARAESKSKQHSADKIVDTTGMLGSMGQSVLLGSDQAMVPAEDDL